MGLVTGQKLDLNPRLKFDEGSHSVTDKDLLKNVAVSTLDNS